MRIATIMLCALALIACAPTAEQQTETEDDAAIATTDSAPTAEAALAVAAIPAGRYSAVSNTATSITGDLTLADNALTFDLGQTYTTQRAGVIEASVAFAPGGGTAASILRIPPTTGVEIRRVTQQTVGARARNGSMCGRDTVTFVALAAATGGDGMPGLWIAAFKGETAPGEAGAAPADLCGTFSYAPASL